MVSVSTPTREALDDWSARAFLLGGGLLAVALGINGVHLVTSIDTQQGVLVGVEGFAGFGGVVLSIVGLVCVYPRLADAAPRLARLGAALAVLPAAFFVALLLGCSVIAPQLGFPSLKTLVPSFTLVTAAIVGLFAVAVAAFGVASLQSAAPPWMPGAPLLVVAGSWAVLFAALLGFPDGIPVWVTFVQTALLAGPLLWVGYQLRAAPTEADSTALAADPVT